MFDIGFLEIIVILVITLLVIGPERMPEVARKIGQFIGKTRRFISSVKDNSEIRDTMRELQDSINIEDEKRSLENVTGSIQDDLSKLQQELEIDQPISRPFAQDDEQPVIGSQYNKAPAQPQKPVTEPEAQPEPKPQQAPQSENKAIDGAEQDEPTSSRNQNVHETERTPS